MKAILLAAILAASTSAQADICDEIRTMASAVMTLTQEYSYKEIVSMMPANDEFGHWLVAQAFKDEYPTGSAREQILFSSRMHVQCRDAQAKYLESTK